MELLARVAAMFALVGLSVTAPGFALLSRLKLRWDPLEKLAGSIALSLILIYFWAFGAFWMGLPRWTSSAATLVILAAAAVSWPEARRLLGGRRVQSILIPLALLALWVVALQALIRNYGGGEWCCDWLEHYQRTMNFVDPKPGGFLYIGRYLFPARPPLMNAVAAHFLNQLGDEFALYQVVFSLLNVLAFVPCCLVARLFVPGGVRHRGVIAVLLGTNPMFYMNATFAWTKLLTAYFVILALWFLLAGARRNSASRVIAAFVCLAAASMVHYSALPYAVFLTAAYLVAVLRRQRTPVVQVAAIGGAVLAVVGPWFLWSIQHYGLAGTLATNSTVTDAARYAWHENLLKIGMNILDTLVPHWWAGAPAGAPLRQLIDPSFMLYQNNLLFAPGPVVSGLAAWGISWRLMSRRSPVPPGEKRFWSLFIPFVIVVGVAAHGERDDAGLAHICLQPLVYMAIAYVAANAWHYGRLSRIVLWAGTVVNLAVGVFLHLYLEHSVADWARTPNWDWKADAKVTFLGDSLAGAAPLLAVLIGAGSLLALGWLWRVLARAPSRVTLTPDGWRLGSQVARLCVNHRPGAAAVRRGALALAAVAGLSVAGTFALGVPEGLAVAYYTGSAIGGSPAREHPNSEVSIRQVMADWNGKPPADLAVQWAGYLVVIRSGDYRFSITSDGSARITLDHRTVAGGKGHREPDAGTEAVRLEHGPHLISIEYVHAGGTPALEWSWARDAAGWSAVSPWQLSPIRVRRSSVLAMRLLVWTSRISLVSLLLLITAWGACWWCAARQRDVSPTL